MSPAEPQNQQHVEADLPCVSCEYNLRTLSIAGVCPECGQPVIKSIRRGLHEADLKWLKAVRLGATILGWTWVGAGAMVLTLLMLLDSVASPSHVITVSAWGVTLLIAYTVGSYRFTQDEPGTQVPAWASVVTAIRACPVVLAFELLMLMWRAKIVGAVHHFVFGTLVVWVVLVDVHARRLARRGRDRDTARFAAATILVCPVTLVATALIATAFLIPVSRSFSFENFGALLRRCACALPLSTFLADLFNLALMFGLRGLLNRAITRQRGQATVDSDECLFP
jgi:hypothetical protein